MVVFEYKGKTFYADNFEKKLKRLKASIDDVKIIDENFDFVRKDKHLETEYVDLNRVFVYDKETHTVTIFYVDSLQYKPDIFKLFEKLIWNNETKTGIRHITIDYITNNMTILNGIPKFPLGDRGVENIELIKEYDWED